MELKIIKTKKQYQEYLDWVNKQFDNRIKPGSKEGEKVQVALLLIKQYEDVHYPVPVPDPIEVIKLKMQDLGLKNKDLVGKWAARDMYRHCSTNVSRSRWSWQSCFIGS